VVGICLCNHYRFPVFTCYCDLACR
jgi:hypothetical protein